MARAALVACAIVAAVATPLAAARAASDTRTGATFVVRGVVVQYIPPSGSIVGSLSIRVLSIRGPGHSLLGELVTVPVEPGSGLKADELLARRSVCTITLNARSAGSILKGAAAVRTIAPAGAASEGQKGGSASGAGQPGNGDTAGKSDSAGQSQGSDTAGASVDHGSAQPSDHGSGQSSDHGSAQGGDHGSAQAADPGSASDGRAAGGSSNGHK
jgi:hypothetical protein